LRLFFRSEIDPRKLSMLPHEIAKQHPSRREFVHGRIHAMDCNCSSCRKIAA
jgi:hypothetical protein